MVKSPELGAAPPSAASITIFWGLCGESCVCPPLREQQCPHLMEVMLLEKLTVHRRNGGVELRRREDIMSYCCPAEGFSPPFSISLGDFVF